MNAQKAQIWAASVVIGIEPKSAQNEAGMRAAAAGLPVTLCNPGSGLDAEQAFHRSGQSCDPL